MGDLGSIFSAGIGGLEQAFKQSANAQSLQNAGYQQYQATPEIALNMGAYGPDATTQANAAQVNMDQANAELSNQQNLISQLQAQSQGSGPNLAAQQLQQGTQANIAAQLAQAAGARGNQNPGAALGALGAGAAAANQQEAAQAAQLRGQQQLSAEGQLGTALGQVSSQQQQLAENQAGLTQAANLQNAAAANQMAQFNTGSAQAGNAAQQAQYQFANNLAAQQQSNENAAIAGQQLSAQNAGQTFTSGALGGAMNGGGAALGNLLNGGGNTGVGNGGPAGGDSDMYSGGSGNAYYGSASSSAPASIPSDSDIAGDWEALGGVNAGESHLVGEAGPEAVVAVPPGMTGGGGQHSITGSNGLRPLARGAVIAPETHVHIHPGQIVNHPEVGKVGETDHPVAVVPLHADGSPKIEAMNPHVQALLEHPAFKKAVANVVKTHAEALKEAFESRRK